MSRYARREFLADIGRGMLIAGIGPVLAADLGLASAHAADGPETLSFGDREPLVRLMQETPTDKLLPTLIARLNGGTDLAALVAAGALANARSFGGQDYNGYHAFMALAPAFHMSAELSAERRALPILKVLYRNTSRIHESGCGTREVLHPISPAKLASNLSRGELLRAATRKADMDEAEHTFAALAQISADEAFNDLLYSVQDEVDVHRVVLAWRARALLDLAGQEQAHTLLRQSVRFCVSQEKDLQRRGRQAEIRTVLPKLLDQYRLLSKPPGTRSAEDGQVAHLAEAIYSGSRPAAAEAVAAALAEGTAPDTIGEALSLAANRLVLCDPGRRKEHAEAGKPEGSVHGASVGVHACDAANAWRNIARVSNARNVVCSLIVGAFHTGGQSTGQAAQPRPLPEHLEAIKTTDAAELLREAEAAVRNRDQARAAAVVHRYGELNLPHRPLFDVLLRYAISEDGALHAEKFYRTVTEEFATTRPAFRWRHPVALARVTASEYGYPAPGYAEACKLLKV
jgi:hypothetical protein